MIIDYPILDFLWDFEIKEWDIFKIFGWIGKKILYFFNLKVTNQLDEKDLVLKNPATSASLTEDSKSFFSCVKKGEEAYRDFVMEKLKVKRVKSFNKIQKARPGKKEGWFIRSVLVSQFVVD